MIYQRFTPSGCKDKGVRKCEIEAKTQLLSNTYYIYNQLCKPLIFQTLIVYITEFGAKTQILCKIYSVKYFSTQFNYHKSNKSILFYLGFLSFSFWSLLRKFFWEGFIGESEEKDTGKKKSKKKAARDFKVTKKSNLCHKLIFSDSYVFASWWCIPFIVINIPEFYDTRLQRYRDFRKSQFVAKTHDFFAGKLITNLKLEFSDFLFSIVILLLTFDISNYKF